MLELPPLRQPFGVWRLPVAFERLGLAFKVPESCYLLAVFVTFTVNSVEFLSVQLQ